MTSVTRIPDLGLLTLGLILVLHGVGTVVCAVGWGLGNNYTTTVLIPTPPSLQQAFAVSPTVRPRCGAIVSAVRKVGAIHLRRRRLARTVPAHELQIVSSLAHAHELQTVSSLAHADMKTTHAHHAHPIHSVRHQCSVRPGARAGGVELSSKSFYTSVITRYHAPQASLLRPVPSSLSSSQ